MRKIIPLIILTLLLTSCGSSNQKAKTITDGVGELSFKISSEWKKTKKSDTEDLTNYFIEYTKKKSKFNIEVYYKEDFEDLLKVEEAICEDYVAFDDSIIKIDGDEAVEYKFNDKIIVHIGKPSALYVMTFILNDDAPNTYDEILKNVKWR